MSGDSCDTGSVNLSGAGGINNHVILDRAVLKSIQAVPVSNSKTYKEREARLQRNYSFDSPEGTAASGPIPLTGPPRLDGNWGKLFPDRKATYYQPKDTDPSSPNYLNSVPSFASVQGGRTPSLFLQELAHLCSLLSAVALSTLRNDVEGAVSPLGVYKPGSPWPEVDPDNVDSYFLNGPWYSRMWSRAMDFMGVARTPEDRTRYNAVRPLEVLGGVSDAEIRFLQMARGPSAKTQLCWYWLTEFVIREHLNGSTGKVGPPIISRIIQFLSDGMIYYNHARKIMFIPFPFPHAQIAVMFVLIAIPAVAFLMDQYADNIVLGCVLTFVSVACLAGIHEVARELENPFRNVPNELPVVTFQAQFNEALIVMYSGFHPDHFWDPTMHDHHPTDPSPRPLRKFGKSVRSPRMSTMPGGPRMPTMPGGISIPRPLSSKKKRSVSLPESESASSSATTKTAATSSTAGTATPSPAVSAKKSNNNQTEELAKMHEKMIEYGKEIERLRNLLEKPEEKITEDHSFKC